LAFIRGSFVRIFRIEIHFDDLKWWRSPRSLQKSGALRYVSNSLEKHVSPSGLEHKQNQSPVADATGNDVSPSGLFANFNNRTGHITRLRHAGVSQPECLSGPAPVLVSCLCFGFQRYKSCQPGGRNIPAGGVSHRNHFKMPQSPEGDTSAIKEESW